MTQISIVVPTFNEKLNVDILIRDIGEALGDLAWEVIFVDDDSPDGTSEKLRSIANDNPKVRCIQRIGRRGLSTAVVEGCLASSAPVFAVMDADLQHPAALLSDLYGKLQAENLDVVVASRFADGSDIGNFSSRRQAISNYANKLARMVTRADLSDPMSGYFVIRREAFFSSVRNLSGQGFKILLDILASSSNTLKVGELPFIFGERRHGTSKLDSSVMWDHAGLLLHKIVGGAVPVRFLMFSLVGALGVAIHFLILSVAMLKFDFTPAQSIATIATMAANFGINNAFTYRDKRLRGWRFLTGMLSFMLVCSIGAIANVGIASAIFGMQYSAWVSALAGIVVGAVWNYVMSAFFTWR